MRFCGAFFLLSLADILCSKFEFSLHQRTIYVNTNCEGNKRWNKYKGMFFTLVIFGIEKRSEKMKNICI